MSRLVKAKECVWERIQFDDQRDYSTGCGDAFEAE
jgi:hypothetical protein